MTVDLDAIEARAEAATLASVDLKSWQGSHLPPLANLIKDAAIELAASAADIPALVAELRAAREVVGAGAALMATYEPTWDGRSLRTPEVAACRAALTAYRTVVGEQE